MRILIHTQFYPPEMGAPQARLSDLARRLRDLGHQVRVLTAMPNYPTGALFPGYPRWFRREEVDGIQVLRSWIIPSNRAGLAHRLVSYLSFAASSFLAGLFAGGAADVVITESPPLFLAPSGRTLAALKGARWVLNVSDLWPESARDIGMMSERSLAYRLLRRIARSCYRAADLVTGQSEGIVSAVARQVPGARTHHLSNGVDTALFGPQQAAAGVRERYLKPGETGFVYAGLHGLFQGLDQVIDLAARLREEPARFLLFGDGPMKEALRSRARQLKLERVEFHPPLPHPEIPAVLASLDVALVTLRSDIAGAVPSKIYEAMASGVPVLLAAGGEARRIIEETGAGLSVAPGDLAGLEEAARRLLGAPAERRAMGERGRMAAVERFDRADIARRFERVLRELSDVS